MHSAHETTAARLRFRLRSKAVLGSTFLLVSSPCFYGAIGADLDMAAIALFFGFLIGPLIGGLLFVRPAIIAEPHAVIFRGALRDHRIPWGSVQEFTKEGVSVVYLDATGRRKEVRSFAYAGGHSLPISSVTQRHVREQLEEYRAARLATGVAEHRQPSARWSPVSVGIVVVTFGLWAIPTIQANMR